MVPAHHRRTTSPHEPSRAAGEQSPLLTPRPRSRSPPGRRRAAATTTAGETAAASAGGGASAPDKIVIGYQAIPNGDLVVKHEGWLEQAFPDTEIEWKIFDSGGVLNEAIAAGSVDFGLAGSSPVARGLSTPLEYQVPWIHDVIGKAEALVAREGITDLEGLRGKKIATPLASTSHYSLLAALDDAGIAQGDVEIIDAEPAASRPRGSAATSTPPTSGTRCSPSWSRTAARR